MKTLFLVVALAFLAVLHAGSQTAGLNAVSSWRGEHEREIVDELFRLVSIPNVSSDLENIRRNVDLLTSLFRRRGFTVETLPSNGTPLVIASLDVVQPRGALTFYAHYDGQPVEPIEQWTRTSPFVPRLIGPDGVVEREVWPRRFDPSWRVYGRSAADDKGPIVALLGAIDALQANGAGPTWSLRVVLDGDEESASPSFQALVASAIPRIRGDVAIILDGPGHPSGRPTLFFGTRGFGARITITVFGADRNLHSGHYGNWAPDPSMRLARLLASFKDDRGRVLVSGF